MTTHSPTTVALAPEESLFFINKSDGIIKKASKDVVLQKLLVGIPYIGISYENRKQVFVESKYDVEFYEKIYQHAHVNEQIHSYIDFISSGSAGSGSCEQVVEIVNSLNRFGNKSIYGIIDWDLHNAETEHIYVLGKDTRYSRENYTFDPLYIGILLIRDRKLSQKDEDWFKNIKLQDIITNDQVLLQKIYNYIFDKLKTKFDINGERIDCLLENNCYIKCYKQLHSIQGHKLTDICFEMIPQLMEYRNSFMYERNIYSKLFFDFPALLYVDMVAPIRKLLLTPAG